MRYDGVLPIFLLTGKGWSAIVKKSVVLQDASPGGEELTVGSSVQRRDNSGVSETILDLSGSGTLVVLMGASSVLVVVYVSVQT